MLTNSNQLVWVFPAFFYSYLNKLEHVQPVKHKPSFFLIENNKTKSEWKPKFILFDLVWSNWSDLIQFGLIDLIWTNHI